MPRPPRTSPRKRPSQERARVTVDAVVEATARVLRERGYAGATLRHIADRAGVGIGSIYQYFPTKEALLAAVMERHVRELAEEMAHRVAATAAAPLPERVRALVAGAVAAHRRDPDLHRVLVEELPRVGRLDVHRETLEALEALVGALLDAHADEIRAGHRPLMAAVLVAAVDAAVHTVVLDRPALADAPIEDEVCRLALSYLAER